MKPLHLQISGLNSFRDRVSIDFDRLLIGGLFGIFGPTGSGKSTILDAMTLALYGKVRRAPGGTQGIINVREPNCTVNFTFEIGSNGGRNRYTIDRVLGRNKTGGIETKRMRLLKYTDGIPVPIAEKKQELKESVQDIVGINVEDFLRAVVLPQGAFAEFLGLETRERGAVLQRLFGLHDLGDRLTSLLRERASELASARAEVEGQLQHLRAYDDAALAAAEEALLRATEEQRAARARLAEAEGRYREGAQLREYLEEYRLLLASDEERRSRAAELEQMQWRIALAERSNAILPAIEAYQNAQLRYSDAARRHTEALAARDAAEARLAPARERLERASALYDSRYEVLAAELEVLGRVREGKQALLGSRERLQRIEAEHAAACERCAEIAGRRDSAGRMLEEVEQRLAAAERELAAQNVSSGERQRIGELNLLIREITRLDEQISGKESEIRLLSKEREGLATAVRNAEAQEEEARSDAGRLAAERDLLKGELEDAYAARETLRERSAVLHHGLAELEGFEREAGNLRTILAKKGSDADGARRTLQELDARLKESTSYEALLWGEREAVAALREDARQRLALASMLEHLHDGDRCPLCGSFDHPDPYDGGDGEAAELAQLDRELARLDGKVRESQERVRDVQQSIAIAATGLEGAELALEGAREQLTINQAAAAVVLKELIASPLAGIAGLRELLTSITEQDLELKGMIDRSGIRLAGLEDDLAAARSRALDAAGIRTRAEADLAVREELLGDLQGKLDELKAALAAERHSFETLSAGRRMEDLGGELQAMQERDRRAEELRARIETERVLAQREREGLAALDRQVREQEGTRDRAEGERRSLEAEIARMRSELSGKLDAVVTEAERGTPVEKLIDLRQQERLQVQRERDEARKIYEDAVLAGVAAKERVDNLWTDFCREEKTREEAGERSRDLIGRGGFASADQVEAAALPREELDRLRHDASSTAKELDDARRRLQELQEKIAGREISSEELSGLGGELERARTADEEGMKGLGGAQERLRECREKNIEWNRVCQQDVAGAENAATADQLMKYLRGNGFVDFLANERLSEICRRATLQLRSLTVGRLEIGARPKDGFFIRDNGNGGIERSPSSLSGGETFLVSLSLALALSETIQLGRSPLEFFFLDEGFGTLDNDLLETVMSSLERLRSEHRAIGVISHVAQLRERIPRRLIVTPPSEQGGSTIRYEVA